METKITQETTNWKIIALLAVLAGFVLLSWMIYDHFNIVLIEKAQLPQWKLPLLQWQILLSILIPPIAGWLADHFTEKGKNYLFITFCMGITAMIFIITAILTGDHLGNNLLAVLPIMMILWMTGMHLFFSPAINLIKKSAKAAHLPIAVGIIFFVADLVYALHKQIIHGVEELGSVWIFGGAGIVLCLLSYLYLKFSKNLPLYLHPDDPSDPILTWMLRALGVGVFGGICKGLLKLDSLQSISQFIQTSDIVSLIFLICAFVVFGLSFVLKNESGTKTLFLGALSIIIGTLFTGIANGTLISIIILLLIIIGISLVSLNIYTVALLRVPEKKYNFAFGLFYSGFSLSAFIMNFIIHN